MVEASAEDRENNGEAGNELLVVESYGNYADLVMPELVKRGATVRALIRDQGKADQAKARGAAEEARGALLEGGQ